MTRRLVVLGAGTAGTMIVNKLRRKLPRDEWEITVVDRDDVHPYQPGYLFLPFGTYDAAQLTKPRHEFVPDGVDLVLGEVDRVDADGQTVHLANGRTLDYDYLVIATGTSPRPDQTPGMLGAEWRRSIFDFYTLEGAQALATALAEFDHGRLVVHVTEMPIKCPVAPLEFTFLAEAWLREHGLRDRVELVYRDAAAGRLHQAGRLRAPRRHAGGAQGRRRERLPGREHRQRAQVPGVLRRTRGPLRPARHGPAQHGRRLRRPGRGWATSSTTCRWTSTPSSARRTTTSSRSATPPTSRPPRPARWRTSRSRSSSTTSSSTSRAGR